MTATRTTLRMLPDLGSGEDHFVVGDLADFPAILRDMQSGAARSQSRSEDEWHGGLSFEAGVDMLSTGDMSRVASSDALLERFEGLAPATRRMQTIAAVSGGAPNVGAHLAGSPIAMRRRERLASDVGPLAIVVDVVSSAGVSNAVLERRGAALLALVRMLSGLRPVSLYVGCSVSHAENTGKACAHMFARIDTAPLDLARSAHVLCSNSWPRQMLYALGSEVMACRRGILWPYGSRDRMAEHAKAILSRAIDCEDMLYVPGIFLHDKLVTDPETWLADMLRQYGAGAAAEIEAAA